MRWLVAILLWLFLAGVALAGNSAGPTVDVWVGTIYPSQYEGVGGEVGLGISLYTLGQDESGVDWYGVWLSPANTASGPLQATLTIRKLWGDEGEPPFGVDWEPKIIAPEPGQAVNYVVAVLQEGEMVADSSWTVLLTWQPVPSGG